MTERISMLAAALDYARMGIPVFPIWTALPLRGGAFVCGCGRIGCKSPAKHPIGSIVPRGLVDATTDEKLVHHFWTGFPNANIGGVTGTVVVVDVDPRHGGRVSDLECRFGPMPPTWRAATGGGGEHIYFASTNNNIKNTAGILANGIDTRGSGGYALLPPSLHVSGRRYEWQPGLSPAQVELAPLPPVIAAALTEDVRAGCVAPTADWRNLARADVAEGKRNASLARFAGHLLRKYVDPLIVMELLAAWNVVRCKPPLDPDELQTILDSIAGRELRRRRAQCQ